MAVKTNNTYSRKPLGCKTFDNCGEFQNRSPSRVISPEHASNGEGENAWK